MELKELIERARAATGPDRELDVDLAWTLEPKRYGAAYWNGCTGKPGANLPLNLDGMGRFSVRANCPPFTASIDAALALVDRRLPGWRWNVGHDANGELYSTIWHGVIEFDEYAPTVPLAIILALLTALDQKEENK